MAAIAIPQFAAYRRRGFDSDVKSNVKNATTAQEAYFVDKNTYTSTVADLTTTRGFRQSVNVGITAAGTASGFVVGGTAIAGCSASTGIWTFDSTTGLITGTQCG